MLCVGLDPDPERIDGAAAGALRHCREVARQTEEHACCFKPNSAFWEQYGPDGWKALIELHEEFADTPFLLDAKRGDMGNTMKAYAHAVFTTLAMDAATVSPYFGKDSLEEFTRYEDRGVYVVCRSSNPGAEDLQHLEADGAPLFLRGTVRGRRRAKGLEAPVSHPGSWGAGWRRLGLGAGGMERRSGLEPHLGEPRDPLRSQSIARGRRHTSGDQRRDREDRMNDATRRDFTRLAPTMPLAVRRSAGLAPNGSNRRSAVLA